MCLIVFAYRIHSDYKLILSANRDEFYARPTAPIDWWEDHQQVFAGRDLEAGGTWMGMNRNGRFAAVTNYRDIGNISQNARSRGELPTDFLTGTISALDYTSQVYEKGEQYNGFNLLAMDKEMYYVSNQDAQPKRLQSGIYGLSNALLDTSWPKVESAKASFESCIQSDFSTEDLLEVMADRQTAADQSLPDTGLDYEREKALSAICIRTPQYGTCCSTVITIDYDDQVNFVEKSFPVGDRKSNVKAESFRIAK